MLTEHAWDRKFGEPLPTLEDVMNEADVMDKTIKYKDKDGNEKEATVGGILKKGEKHPAYDDAKQLADKGGDKKSDAGKLGGGDYERDFDDSEPEDKPFGGDTGADADSETGKDYVSKFQGTDEPEGGEPAGGEEGEVDREEVAQHFKDLTFKSDNEQGTVNPAVKSMLQSDDPNENEGAREYLRNKSQWAPAMTKWPAGSLESYFEDVGADEEFFAKEQETYDANEAKMKELDDKEDLTGEEEEEYDRIWEQNKGSKNLLAAGEKAGLHKQAEGGKEESIKVINGKKYRAIKDSVEPKKHILRETYERIGGK